MLVPALRITLALLLHTANDARTHEIAHRACEITVYALVAPDATDDATTPLGEAIAEIACRNDGGVS